MAHGTIEGYSKRFSTLEHANEGCFERCDELLLTGLPGAELNIYLNWSNPNLP